MNLNQQISLLNQKLEIQTQKTALEHDRAEFYKEQGVEKDKLLAQSNALTEKALKEAESKTLWKSVGIGSIIALIAIIAGTLL